MDELVYWVWLSICYSYGSNKPNELLAFCDTPKELYEMSEEERKKIPIIFKDDLTRLKLTSLRRAELIIDQCQKNDISIVTLGDKLYPSRLKMIYGPPVVLYYKGNLADIDNHVCIGIVGTRDVSEYYAFTTEYLAYHLAKANALVISGCAVGCDTAAHRGALKANKRTISVLACGLDVDYPKESHKLKEEVLQSGGALVSEMVPGENTNSKIFHARNRLIAGLSNGVLVTQAPVTSGALITAEHALDQGKDVFCIPPFSIFDSECAGVIKYLRDGAIPAFCVGDILSPYISEYAHMLDIENIAYDYVSPNKKARAFAAKSAQNPQTGVLEKEKEIQNDPAEELQNKQQGDEQEKEQMEELRKKQESLLNSIAESARIVYNKLELSPKYVDVLSVECKIPTAKLLAILTELELIGLCQSHSGNRYSLNK